MFAVLAVVRTAPVPLVCQASWGDKDTEPVLGQGFRLSGSIGVRILSKGYTMIVPLQFGFHISRDTILIVM